MELRLLVTFEKVATVLSFTQAAAELKYAQSSVTSQIRALEASLGTELFDRLGSRIRLTEAGERLLPYARRIIDLSAEARTAVNGVDEPNGTINIGTMESLTSYRLPALLEFFHHRYPLVKLSLRPTLGDETRQALRQGVYDIGFLMERETVHTGLETEVLTAEPLVLVCAPTHALAGEAKLTTVDLSEVQLVGTEPGCPYRDLFERELRESTGTPPPFMEFGTIEATKRGVAGGLGVALLPRMAVRQELATGVLVALPWEPPFQLHTQVAWREGKRLPRHVRLFIDETVRLVREQESSDRSEQVNRPPYGETWRS
ncbi:LysR family transcriptional regulator [Streptomyces lunaelactis]|uniref:LysR family transcriptional regulator n=1 Tax=Streptomyces lunaelactis TaxID=1535768 RepID=UPI00158557D2|nr:LysR family transcriptional regulator [Streptomyces lunaelactis]NUK02170.1 LysR family transcriptional regulator [Streptomyces lunaelactis]NUK08792.1 LysR family transcriptional regulator [Streptomyces lunaelactis]NUK16003.1 LysR family transcriptional regulator [Streptomyces lunaelactis]NUK25636.1 LysR family transcriptional regulator [Streptomyces lunaelactis]NUK49620.1 LysR family transcriptional regulator [Streptomyces lunaelactis]